MDRPTTKEIARFFDKVRITKHCWLWIASLDRCGYGRFSFRGGKLSSSHFSYELFVGSIELGKHILHRKECSSRACVNPNHLYLGTNADNVRDRTLWGNQQRGETHPSVKLSKKDVLEIRRIHKGEKRWMRPGRYKNTANLFGVSVVTISRIVSGKAWKHLPLGGASLPSTIGIAQPHATGQLST